MESTIRLTAPYETVNRISQLILANIEEEDIGEAAMALTLTLGRILSISGMPQRDEVAFVSAVLDYAGAFVATTEGMVN